MSNSVKFTGDSSRWDGVPVTQARTCVLFVCRQNKLRSLTTERIFSGQDCMECLSVGLDSDAANRSPPNLCISKPYKRRITCSSRTKHKIYIF